MHNLIISHKISVMCGVESKHFLYIIMRGKDVCVSSKSFIFLVFMDMACIVPKGYLREVGFWG